jgi:serine protease Do
MFPTFRGKRLHRVAIFGLVAFYFSFFTGLSFAQKSADAASGAGTQAGNVASDKAEAANPGNLEPNSLTRPGAEKPILQQLNSAVEELAARISPAVVQISVTGYGTLEESNQTQTAYVAREHAIGSGVIVDSDGYIMTNAHVVEGAQRIHVALASPMNSQDPIAPIGKQRMLDARIIGIHKESDLALLKVEGTNFPTLSLANHRPVHQGELVLAMGSPEGLQNSVTMGVVSSVGRQADPTKPFVYIQTDAPINPGNSGGPLVDIDGYVIGINTFILSSGGGSEGLGFAIPSQIVRFVYASLRKYGHVHRVSVKAGAQTITPTLARGLGLARSWGVVIDDVTPGGPAESAGLKIGDIILSADGRAITTLPAFTTVLYFHSLDEVLKLEVLRGNERKTLFIPVFEQKDSMDTLADLVSSPDSLVSRLGILAIDLTEQLRGTLGPLRNPTGVVVVARVADFARVDTSLQTGDVIHAVNQTPIDSLATLREALRQIKARDAVVLQVERSGGFQWLAFDME